MSEFATGVAKSTFFPPLCLWCENFNMDLGSEGTPRYSEWTPGSSATPYEMQCRKKHWVFNLRYESHYRECILTAVTCPDFSVNEQVLHDINDAAGKPIKPSKKGRE